MATRSDELIKENVLNELKWDTRVEETEVGVSVFRSVVTLIGTVSSYAKKVAAQEAAHRVTGVLDVANDIEVRLPGAKELTDAEIARAVRNALEWDVLVPDKAIRTTVVDGMVTLEGQVNYLSEREDAERAVRYLRGVRGVINRLTITWPALAEQDVRELIEKALERRAERKADRIDISVQNGVIQLSGKVGSWGEKRAIIGSVSHAPGIARVEDNLRVEPWAAAV